MQEISSGDEEPRGEEITHGENIYSRLASATKTEEARDDRKLKSKRKSRRNERETWVKCPS